MRPYVPSQAGRTLERIVFDTISRFCTSVRSWVVRATEVCRGVCRGMFRDYATNEQKPALNKSAEKTDRPYFARGKQTI